MNLSIKSALVALAVSAGAFGGSAATAQAGDVGVWFGPRVGVGVGFGGVGVGVGVGVGPAYHGHHGYCSTHEALHRAASMGVRNGRVTHVSDSRVTVRGTRKGQSVRVVMYRHSDFCTVRSVNYL